MNLVDEGKHKSGSTHYVVNVRLLLITVVVLVVAVPTIYFWHSFSVGRISQAFLNQANKLIEEADILASEPDKTEEAEKTLSKAVDMIWQYRRVWPDDQPSAVLMARTFDRSLQGRSGFAGRRRAAQLYAEASALTFGPEVAVLKSAIGDIMLETGDFAEARNIGQQLINFTDSGNVPVATAVAAGSRIYAIALFEQLRQGIGRSGPTDLGEAFATAIDKNPSDTRLPVLLAAIYRDENYQKFLSATQRRQLTDTNITYAQKADEIVDQMAQRNETVATAHLQRYYYRTQVLNSLTPENVSEIEHLKISAQRDLNRALEIDPTDPQVNFEMGRFLQNQFRQLMAFEVGKSAELTIDQRAILEKARQHFENCIPKLLEARLCLGEVQSALGLSDDALRTWSRTMALPEFQTARPSFQSVVRQRFIAQLIDLNRLDEAEQELKAMNEYIALLRKRTGTPQQIAELLYLQDFLGGYLKFRQHAYGEAIALLEKRIPDQEPVGPWTLDVIRLLGALYLELDQPELAANVYQIAVGIDRSGTEFGVRLSQALARSQRFNLSANALKPVANDSDSAVVWLEFASTLLQQELQKTPELRNLDPVNNALRKARELNKQNEIEQPWRLDMMQLQTIIASQPAPLSDPASDPASVTESMVEFNAIANRLESDFGENTDMLKALVGICHQAGKIEDVQRIVKKYETLAGDVPDRFIFVASMQAAKREFEAAAKTLVDGLSRVKDQEKLPLQLAQISLLLGQGEFAAALAQLEKTVQENETPELVIKIAHLLIQFPNLIQPQPAAWESRLPKIEGEKGPLASMLAVHRLLLEYDNTKELEKREKLLEQAADLCAEVKQERPNWAAVYSLYGLVQELSQNVSIQRSRLNQPTRQSPEAERLTAEQKYPAKRSYQQALDLGESRPFVLIRLANLETDPEARRNVLARFDQRVVASNPDLSNMQMAAFIAGNDLENAVKVAELATLQRPADPTAWITRARVELINGSLENSLQSIAKGKSLLENSPEPIQAMLELFRFYTTADEYSPTEESNTSWEDEARGLIPGILERVDDKFKLLLHAALLEELNDVTASDLYLQAISKGLDDRVVLERALRYFASANSSRPGALDQAIDIASKLLDIDSANTQYVQVLAGLLARRGSAGDFERVAELLGGQRPGSADSVENQRIMAILLLTRVDIPNSERLDNLQRAREIVGDSKSTVDLYLAGQILRAWAQMLTGESQDTLSSEKLLEAEACFNEAIATPDVSAPQLYAIADFFIEQGKTDSQKWDVAESLIEKLRSLPSDSIIDDSPIISLTARLRHARGTDSHESVIKFVEEYGASVEQASNAFAKNIQAKLFQQIADMLIAIEAKEQALIWLEKAANLDTNQQLRLALERARNGNLDKALEQCIEGYEETREPKFAIAIAEFLLTENGSPQHYEHADKVFELALENHPDDLVLLMSIGNARIAGQNRVEDAIKLYQKALKIEPNNRVLLNNLATALSELPENLPDALRTIDLAISLHGNRPGLLDTKAVVLMLNNDLVTAEQILSNIVNTNSDSRYWWHLAEVQWKLYEQTGKPADLERAQQSFDQSIDMGLEKEILTPGEKQRLSTLKDNLASRKIGVRTGKLFPVAKQPSRPSERTPSFASCPLTSPAI